MSQKNRLASGGRLDRTQPLSFSYNGRQYPGFAGDTVASALLANGVDIVGRSFKYSRPRGIIAAGAGLDIPDLNRLLKQQKMMAKMMKKMRTKGGMKDMMRGMQGMMGGGGGGMPPGM